MRRSHGVRRERDAVVVDHDICDRAGGSERNGLDVRRLDHGRPLLGAVFDDRQIEKAQVVVPVERQIVEARRHSAGDRGRLGPEDRRLVLDRLDDRRWR